MNFLLAFVFSLLSFNLKASDTVRVSDPENFALTATSTTTYSLNVESLSGDATSESSPAVVYVPVKNSSVANYDLYLLDSRSGAKPLETATTVSTINFPLLITVGSTAKWVYTAVKVNGKFYVATKSGSTYSNLTDFELTFSVSPNYYCTAFTLSGTGATNPCSDTATFTTTLTTYFFLSNTAYANGAEISTTTESGGVYFNLKLSNRIYQSSELSLSLTNVRKGDKRIIMDYAASATMANFLKVKAFLHGAPPGSDNNPIGDTVNYPTGSVFSQDLGTAQSGSVTVNELTNGTTYFISLFFVDQYRFTSVMSPDVSETPTEIQELLKKQACFLLTAGFGEEHFIIDYFRNYRDQVLAQSFGGKQFIKLYYTWGPKLSLSLYESPFLRSVVRACAFLLYLLFKYNLAFMAAIGVIFTFANLRKNKIAL